MEFSLACAYTMLKNTCRNSRSSNALIAIAMGTEPTTAQRNKYVVNAAKTTIKPESARILMPNVCTVRENTQPGTIHVPHANERSKSLKHKGNASLHTSLNNG
jgi:hypothetical protein